MKIKAKDIQPGMVIGINRGGGYDDISLVTATKGYDTVEYTHFDYQDGYMGKLVGTLDGKIKVKVIKGNQRQKVIKKIKTDLHRLYWDAKTDIDLIWLIQAMDKT